MKPFSLLPPGVSAALLLSGCATTGVVTDTTDLDGPVFGKKDETKFVAGTDGGAVGLKDLAKVAKTIRKYKNLNADEREIIRRVAALKLEGLVAAEMRKLAPQYEKKKEEVRQETRRKIEMVRKRAPDRRDQRVAAEVKRAEEALKTEETHRLARIDLEWRSAATAEVAKTHGTDFAVPVANSEGKAVVAFASVKESGVSVSDSSYEVASATGTLSSQQTVAHSGKKYAVLDEKIQ